MAHFPVSVLPHSHLGLIVCSPFAGMILTTSSSSFRFSSLAVLCLVTLGESPPGWICRWVSPLGAIFCIICQAACLPDCSEPRELELDTLCLALCQMPRGMRGQNDVVFVVKKPSEQREGTTSSKVTWEENIFGDPDLGVMTSKREKRVRDSFSFHLWISLSSWKTCCSPLLSPMPIPTFTTSP